MFKKPLNRNTSQTTQGIDLSESQSYNGKRKLFITYEDNEFQQPFTQAL